VSLAANKANIPRLRPSAGLSAALLLTGGMTLLQVLPESWRGLLRYDRPAVADGEIWRLLTANFIHLGWAHLILNVCALLLMGWLFGEERSRAGWATDLMICAVVCNVGLFLFSPEIIWVVGLSGALHGLFIVGAVGWIRQGVTLGWGLLLAVSLKVGWEQLNGEMPLTAEIVGGNVVTDAHLWGAVGGVAAVLVSYIWFQFRARL
jgi:rhomboid family GlyGly-CTERM serine protease